MDDAFRGHLAQPFNKYIDSLTGKHFNAKRRSKTLAKRYPDDVETDARSE